MSENFVNYDSVDETKIRGFSPEEKQIPNSTNKYQQIGLSYNYGDDEHPVIDNFYIQLPVVSSTGILERDEEGKNTKTYSMYVPLPTSDDNKVFIDNFNKTFMKTAEILMQYKGQCKITAPNLDFLVQGGIYKNPIYYPRDKSTNEIIPGKTPSIYLKLYKRGAGPFEEKTLFCDLKGNPIKWELLYGVDMKLIPLVHVEKIFVGATVKSLQFKMVSAVVLEVHPRGTQSKQLSTIQQLSAREPDRAAKLDAQLAKLSMERQDFLPGAKNTNSQGGQTQSSQVTTPSPQSVPSTPSAQTANQSSLEGFLQGATPVRLNIQKATEPVAQSPPRVAPKIPQLPTFNAPTMNFN